MRSEFRVPGGLPTPPDSSPSPTSVGSAAPGSAVPGPEFRVSELAPASTELRVSVEGRIASLSPEALRGLLERDAAAATPELVSRVANQIEDVRRDGDLALHRFAREFDGVELEQIEVPAQALLAALDAAAPDVRAALEAARDAIAAFHRAQLPAALELETRPGVRLGRRPEPLERIGVYAPGGRAAYPSSVLMGVVPAKVAGVSEVVVCSPPSSLSRTPVLSAAPRPSDAVLAACALAGADRVFALGGAGAIAALAFGTRTVPRVDKVVGPGNAHVTEAKRQLNGVLATDSPAGPSEILIIADDTADARLVAVELIAQAEHDPDAAAVLVTTRASLVDETRRELTALVREQPRRAIIARALAAHGALLLADDLGEAVAFAERYAPEHLLLLVDSPRRLLDRVRAAGTIFLGASSSVAFGDYITGANHVLPTGGRARAWSGLSTSDFVRWTTWQEVSIGAASALADATATLADAEGLPAHALAARLRVGAPMPAPAGLRQSGEDAADPSGLATTRTGDDRAPIGDETRPALREVYRGIGGYQRPGAETDGTASCAVNLSDNTNLFGPSPAVADLLGNCPPALITRYPSVYADRLKRAIVDRFGVAPDNVTTGCGSDDVIDSAVRAFCEPGATLTYPWPTFGVVPMFARINAVQPLAVPLGPDFALDADALIAKRAELTYLCRPNNPTGTPFDRAAVERICRDAAGVVLIDEAYADFADAASDSGVGGDDFVGFAVASTRTIVLRTFSKAYGLAGLRAGFAIGPAELIREIEKSRGPYKINALAEAAATAVLEQDGAWVRKRIDTVRENRGRLAIELARLGLVPLPSAANFLLVPLPDWAGTALDLGARLAAEGVAVRPFPALPRVGDCIRVTIGPWPMLQTFIDALARLLERRGGRAAPKLMTDRNA